MEVTSLLGNYPFFQLSILPIIILQLRMMIPSGIGCTPSFNVVIIDSRQSIDFDVNYGARTDWISCFWLITFSVYQRNSITREHSLIPTWNRIWSWMRFCRRSSIFLMVSSKSWKEKHLSLGNLFQWPSHWFWYRLSDGELVDSFPTIDNYSIVLNERWIE